MEIKLSVEIAQSVEKVFEFLQEFENHHQESKSQVLLVEKLTSGPAGIGSRYRETVQMIPLVKSKFVTELSGYDPNEHLEFTWSGGGMEGMLEYRLEPDSDQTRVNFREHIYPKGLMRLAGPMIKASFRKKMEDRLEGIKRAIEHSS